LDWSAYTPTAPLHPGITVLNDFPLEEIRKFIDWTPFFSAWQLTGKFPAILEDEIIGKAATDVYNDAQKMIDQIINEKWLQANGTIGLCLPTALETI
jgi:5-methyltetrahydrofolate--homocysteine methyltransferase